jgi:predicted CoA-binding protein
MQDASMEDITKFLACKRIALVGVSRNAHHFSRALLGEFLEKGYDAVPVNPNAAEIDGRKCFPRVSEITPQVQAALLLTGASELTIQAVRECSEADIRHIWVYKPVKDGKDDTQTLEFCRLRGAALIEGHCPFMFLPHPALIHRVHRFISKVGGSYPV